MCKRLSFTCNSSTNNSHCDQNIHIFFESYVNWVRQWWRWHWNWNDHQIMQQQKSRTHNRILGLFFSFRNQYTNPCFLICFTTVLNPIQNQFYLKFSSKTNGHGWISLGKRVWLPRHQLHFKSRSEMKKEFTDRSRTGLILLPVIKRVIS